MCAGAQVTRTRSSPPHRALLRHLPDAGAGTDAGSLAHPAIALKRGSPAGRLG